LTSSSRFFDFQSIKVFALPSPYGHSKLHLSLWLE
jgi:hypothetical protein